MAAAAVAAARTSIMKVFNTAAPLAPLSDAALELPQQSRRCLCTYAYEPTSTCTTTVVSSISLPVPAPAVGGAGGGGATAAAGLADSFLLATLAESGAGDFGDCGAPAFAFG